MAMDEQIVCETSKVKLEEEDEDFISCCEDEDELEEREEYSKIESNCDLDEHSVKMYFKGVSVIGPGDSNTRISGVGVVMERSCNNASPIQIQKKLDFYVEELVADYLALLDGLSVAVLNKVRQVFAFTDSEILHNQIMHDEVTESPLLLALKQRIMEQASNVEAFVLKLVPTIDLQRALHLAHVAVGIVSLPTNGDEITESCSICCEDKLSSMMLTIKCSHKFCSHCMKTYVEGKLHSTQVPIVCPEVKCKYRISASECRSFLPVTSYENLERALAEANVLDSNRIYCPYPSCSVLFDPRECLSATTRASSSSQCDDSCVECPVCEGLVCVDCGAVWHSSMNCEEYRNIPLEDRDASVLSLHRLARNQRWRRCQQCRSMIELAHGCYHMTCRCGHEFCYSCGAEYREGQQTCECAFWDEDYSETYNQNPTQQLEQWSWDSFESLPMDTYSEQERSQLALIHRFLSGGFSFTDHHTSYGDGDGDDDDQSRPSSCTDSYADAMKDLHQLPWLERFVSVISDNYYEDYIQ